MAKIPAKAHLINIQRVKNPQESRGSFLRLDKNENTIDFNKEMTDLFKNQITPDFLAAYPEIDSLYAKIASYLKYREENIYITAGSDAAIKAVFEVFVEKGDKVALLDPTYAMYYVYGEIFQAKVLKINFKEDLSLDMENILNLIEEERPKLICLANPNAPTGTVIAPEGLKRIVDLCSKYDIVVLIDEAYYPYYSHSAISLIPDYPNLVITRTFSKAFGLASCRLGFAVGQPEIIGYLHKVRPMYETNAFAAKFGELILDNYGIVEKNVEEVNRAKEYLEKELSDSGIPFFKSYANFMLIDVSSFEKAVQIKQEMKNRKILIAGGFKTAPLEKCIRVSIGNIEQMKYFFDNFKQIFNAEQL
ncbi:MAG: histidinol-phosphate transaminase [bacterium]|nr:histidinol-phosphate transaminase [bacterium]